MAKKTPHKKTDPSSLPERAQKYIEEDIKLMKKYQLNKQIVVLFPKAKQPPRFGRFSLWLLRKSGAVIDLQFNHLEE